MPTFENYQAFLYDIQNQLDRGDGSIDPSDTSPVDPAHLLAHHLDLLVDLQQALAARAHNPAGALQAWELIERTLWEEAEAAKSVVDDGSVAGVEGQLEQAGRNFVGAAYHAAERAAEGGLEAPDLAEQQAHLESAEHELLEADKLWENAAKVMASGVDRAFDLEGTAEIIELVKLPGTIREKTEKARETGLIEVGTAVALVGKIKKGTATLLKVTAATGERYCAAAAGQAARQGNEVLVREIEERAAQWKWLGETAETMGTLASVVTLIGDGLALVDSIRAGNWEQAAGQTLDMLADALPLVAGMEIAGPLAAAVIVVKAELQAIHAAAEFILYCKDEQVRQAAGDYVQALTDHVHPWAVQLAADVEVMLDPTQPESVQRAAMDKVTDAAKNTWLCVEYVGGNQLERLDQQAHSAYESMGADAYDAFREFGGSTLSMPVETQDGVIALSVVDRVAKIFHGANLMAEYVHAHYTN